VPPRREPGKEVIKPAQPDRALRDQAGLAIYGIDDSSGGA
jgi:hypothetical protein